ncbi:hypothetical protein ABIE65_004973 [Constrictibacter sp. MBR-5]
MFEIGKRYEIRMIIGGDETAMWRTVEKYEHPMVKFATEHFDADKYFSASTTPGEIVNVTSPNFISAVEDAEKPIPDRLKPGTPPKT